MITFATKATKLKLESWLNFRKTWALKRFHFSNHAKNQKGVMHYMMGPFKKKRKYCHAKKLTPHLLIFWLLSLAWIIFSLTVKIFYIFIAKKILVNTSKFYISYSSENSINLENSISTFYQCRIYFGAIIQIFPILSVLFYEFNICGIFTENFEFSWILP